MYTWNQTIKMRRNGHACFYSPLPTEPPQTHVLQYNGEKASLHERSLKKASKMLQKNSLLGHMNSIVSLAPCRRFITGSWVNNTITMVSQQQKQTILFVAEITVFWPSSALRNVPIDNIPAAPVIPEKKIPPGLAVARATNQIDGNDVAGKVTPETVTNGPATIKMAEMAGTLTLQKLSTSALKQSKSAQDVCRSTCLLYFPRLKRRC